jgi:diguanylate cyclase (GGDEF)-like protein
MEKAFILAESADVFEKKELTELLKHLLNTLSESEFVNKLAAIIYKNTVCIGVRVMTNSYIKIIGKSEGLSKSLLSDHLKIIVYYKSLSDSEFLLIDDLFEIAKVHLSNILYHNEIVKAYLHDQLTGAYSRHAGMEILDKMFESTKRSQRSGFLIFIDIDNLKTFNDKYGHSRGDELLRNFAKTFLSIIRKSDVLVRYGGDEFLLYLESDDPEKVIERIKAHGKIDFSYGIVKLSAFNSLQEAINAADLNMYERKKLRKKLMLNRDYV